MQIDGDRGNHAAESNSRCIRTSVAGNRLILRDLYCHDMLGTAIQLNAVTEFEIQNCITNDNTIDGITCGANCHFGSIYANTVLDNEDSGIVISGTAQNTDIIIEKNTVRHDAGVSVGSGIFSSGDRTIINSNIVTGAGTGAANHGISIADIPPSILPNNAIISNNIVDGPAADGINVANNATTPISINGNNVTSAGSKGIHVVANANDKDRVIVSNNIVHDGDAEGILFEILGVGDLDNVIINGNISGDTRSAGQTQTHGLRIVDSGAGAASDFIVNSNDFSNNITAAITAPAGVIVQQVGNLPITENNVFGSSTTVTNAGAGADPVIISNSALQILDITGTLRTSLDLSINNLRKLFLDGGLDTSIRHSASDTITVETGGDDFMVIQSGQVDFEDSGSAGLVNMTRQDATTFKLYELVFNGDSSTGVKRQFGKLIVSSPVNTNAVEDGKFDFSVRENGVDTEYLSMNAQAGHIFFRKPISVPAATKIFLDGSATGNTSIRGEVAGDDIIFETAGTDQWTILSNGDLEQTFGANVASSGAIRLSDGVDGAIRFDNDADQMQLDAGNKRISMGLSGTQPAAGSSSGFTYFDNNSILDVNFLIETGDGTSIEYLNAVTGGTLGSTATIFISQLGATDDTGSRAVMEFVARRDTPAVISTRPLFEWFNHTTLELAMAVDGDLQLQQNAIDFNTDGHSITPAATSLTIDANVSTDSIDLQTGGASRLLINGTTDIQMTQALNIAANGITVTSRATGDILKDNGTNLQRLAMGTANQVLKVNPAGTDVIYGNSGIQAMIVAASDETTVLTVADGKTEFQMPYAFTLTDVRATLTTAGTTSGVTTVDIEDDGVSIFSTLLTIDFDEKTSTSAATPAVISGAALADGSVMKINVDVLSGGATEAGLKIAFIGYQT